MAPKRAALAAYFNSVVLRLTRSGLAVLVFWTGVILTLLTTYLAYDRAHLTAQLRFKDTTEEIHSHIEERLQTYVTALRQARALFSLRDDADRESFHVMTETIHPAAEYPGLVGIGFVEAIHQNNTRAFENKIRSEAESSGDSGKSKDAPLRVWFANTAKSDGEDWAIRFFEPRTKTADGRSPIGYVIDSDPRVTEALAEARDSGTPALTKKIAFPFDLQTEGAAKPAFILALPVFKKGGERDTVKQRRENLRGYVFAAFDAKGFFEGPISKAWLASRHVEFSVYEEPVSAGHATITAAPLYEHAPAPKAFSMGRSFQTVLEVTPASHPLWLRISTTAGFLTAMDLSGPWILLAFGIVLSLLLYQVLKTHAEHSNRLVKSERQLQLVTDALPVLISYVDSNEHFLFNNRAYESWYRITRDKMQGQPLRAVLDARTYNRIKPYVRRALSGETVSFDTELQLPDHETRPVHANFIPDFSPSGTIKGFVALYSDTTESRRLATRGRFLVELSSVLGASLEVEETLAKLASLLSPTIADWCLIDLIDEGGFKRLIAHSHDLERNALLKTLGKKTLPDDRSHLSQKVARDGEAVLLQKTTAQHLVAKGTDQETEIDILTDVGCTGAMLIPLRARNHTLGTLTLVASTPDRKFTPDDLSFAVDIGRRAALALDNARLYRETSHANRAKDEFLATLSHELRTPMNVILGWLELLSTEKFNEETYKQALATLTRNADLQLQLINDLLDVSKIVNGKITLQVKNANLAALIESAVEAFQPAARAKNIALDVDFFSVTNEISGDAARLHQVLWNLLSNALKFTPEGGRVGVRLEDHENGLQITVEDSGRGMDPQFLPFIFDRFRQEETGSSRSQGGLGLGLSIVRYLVELHGGTIEARSKGRGHGSSFVLTLPRRLHTEKTTPVYKEAVAPGATEKDLIGLHVLVVDDSPDVRILVERILKRAGCLVSLAEDAKSAWTLLSTDPPEVLLSDLGLPHEDGLSLMKRWRAHEAALHLPRLPSAAMTGFVQTEDTRRTLDAGFDLHVAKPVTAKDLLEALRTLKKRSPELDAH